MAVFWVVAPCSLVEKFTNVSEVLAASIIRAIDLMVEAAKRSTTLHGATTRKTAILK
jgi:hypothetical protein